MNNELEKALEETWANKDKFYEETKGLSMLEIVKQIESRYKIKVSDRQPSVRTLNQGTTDSQHTADIPSF